jgi:release factor glutamine methyltransferase
MDNTHFFGLPLLTARGEVMTPRPATERLVAAAAVRIGARPARVADVGTGSGAIAVTLALAAPRAEIWASDISPSAVFLARANAQRFRVDDRVHVVHGDLLDPIPEELDLIVANLPYLPEDDWERYPDLRDEPASAVFADGDGSGPYRRLLAAAGEKLVSGGSAVIQFRRRVFVADRDRLVELAAILCAA